MTKREVLAQIEEMFGTVDECDAYAIVIIQKEENRHATVSECYGSRDLVFDGIEHLAELANERK